MSLSTDPQMSHLPKRLPVGSVYVVEGRVGRHGRFRVSSRFVVMPGGAKVDFPLEFRRGGTGPNRAPPAWVATVGCVPNSAGFRRKKILAGSKKIALAAGTRRQKQR